MAKGSIDQHLIWKEEIDDALGEKMVFGNNHCTIDKQRKDLNGLQKMREVIKINYEDTERAELSKRTLPVLKNPRILAGMIDTDRRLLAPLWQTLIEEGQADGSINTEYAKELSELIPLLSDLWLTPTTYPACEKEIMNRFNCMSAILDAMGIPLFNSELKELVEHRVEELLK